LSNKPKKKNKKKNTRPEPAAEKDGRKNKILKFSLIAVAAVAVITIAVVIAISLSSSGLVKITFKDGKFIDKKNGVEYALAPICFEPFAVGEPYAEYSDKVLYDIPGLSPKEWLTEEYEGISSLYYSSSFELPDIGEFEPDSVGVCSGELITIQDFSIDDRETIDAIVNVMSGESISRIAPAGYKSWHLKFTSKKYPNIYYDVLYIKSDDGNYFYNRGLKKVYDAGDIMDFHLPDDVITE